MRTAVISANLGGYDEPHPWVEQVVPDGVTVDVFRFTDERFPPRPLAMTSRLQCGLLKWFGWDFVPGFDCYLWVDASCALTKPDMVARWLRKMGDAELLLFEHPERQTVREEYDFIKRRMARPGETYLNGRYAGEWLDEQFEHIDGSGYANAPLFATTAFMYRATNRVRSMLKEAWFGKTRWLLHDQLYFAFALALSGCTYRTISDNYLDCSYLEFVRNRK